MNLSNKHVLVTGAGGFIGSHLVEELVSRKCRVRAMVHYNSQSRFGNLELLPAQVKNRIEIFSGDVTDMVNVKKAVDGCDVVFHLAALISIPYSYSSPFSFVQTNVLGTLNVMQACLEGKVRKVVHTSTSEAYGTAVYTPIDEDHPLQGQSPYSASKIGADKIAESYHKSFGLPVATIRPFNTFGPRQSARAVIPTVITQILSGRQEINLGSLTPVRDMVYVKDTVNGFIRIAESEKSAGEVINIGTGRGVTIKDLAGMIKNMCGSQAKIVHDKARLRPEKSEVMKLVCDSRKARRLVGWKPEYSLEDGLRETVKYVRDYMNLYKVGLYNI